MTDTDDDPHYFTINNAEISIDADGWMKHNLLKETLNKLLGHSEFISESKHHQILKQVQDDAFSVLLTNDTHIQQLNNDFRKMDKPTNVLSFPADEDDYLGDIAISLETIEKEAIEQDKDFYHHFIHMLIHGVLHLKGYDHLTDKDAEEMEALEIKILADIGIKNPYI